MTSAATEAIYDLVIIGGGINGCGIARDASGRGLKVLLCEKDDLAQATSSASTKLFHGGLRYLEYYEFRLVREALKEREVLLRAMPHISWPLRFVLPHHSGLRPKWLLRLGLFIYDHMGGRKILPPTRTLNLRKDAAGASLQDRFTTAFEYSDCWVEDSRLVVLNARDASDKGAVILTQTACQTAGRNNGLWQVTLRDETTQTIFIVKARCLVNAGGPWVEDIFRNKLGQNSSDRTRLVRGSHIVTGKLFDHDRPYFFQQSDGRIIFAIPYETDFTVIGTTDLDHRGDPGSPVCSEAEKTYLCNAASEYFKNPVTTADVVWSYSGVRPLYDDGASSATAATRDYVLKVEVEVGVPLLNVFGGKITTYRKLAEAALAKLHPWFPEMGQAWTAGAALPGGDFPVDGVLSLISHLHRDYPFLDEKWAKRLIRAYGTLAFDVLKNAKSAEDLGRNFGWNLTERDVEWLRSREFAHSAADILWRRSKIGLRLSQDEITALELWFAQSA